MTPSQNPFTAPLNARTRSCADPALASSRVAIIRSFPKRSPVDVTASVTPSVYRRSRSPCPSSISTSSRSSGEKTSEHRAATLHRDDRSAVRPDQQRRFVTGTGDGDPSAGDVQPTHQRGDEQGGVQLVDEDPVGAPERVGGARGSLQRRVDDWPGERHQQRRGDALAGDIGDHDSQRAAATSKPEELEEVAADLARRFVIAREVVAGDFGRLQRDDAALLDPADGQLGSDAALGIASRQGAVGPLRGGRDPLDGQRDGFEGSRDRPLPDGRTLPDESTDEPALDDDVPGQPWAVERRRTPRRSRCIEPDDELVPGAREGPKERPDGIGRVGGVGRAGSRVGASAEGAASAASAPSAAFVASPVSTPMGER